MKKLILNTNPFILLLAPIFLITATYFYMPVLHLQLPDVNSEITGLFNQKTLFQVTCEVVKDLIW